MLFFCVRMWNKEEMAQYYTNEGWFRKTRKSLYVVPLLFEDRTSSSVSERLMLKNNNERNRLDFAVRVIIWMSFFAIIFHFFFHTQSFNRFTSFNIIWRINAALALFGLKELIMFITHRMEIILIFFFWKIIWEKKKKIGSLARKTAIKSVFKMFTSLLSK